MEEKMHDSRALLSFSFTSSMTTTLFSTSIFNTIKDVFPTPLAITGIVVHTASPNSIENTILPTHFNTPLLPSPTALTTHFQFPSLSESTSSALSSFPEQKEEPITYITRIITQTIIFTDSAQTTITNTLANTSHHHHQSPPLGRKRMV